MKNLQLLSVNNVNTLLWGQFVTLPVSQDGFKEPSLATILWRYYWSEVKDASQVSTLQEDYVNQLADQLYKIENNTQSNEVFKDILYSRFVTLDITKEGFKEPDVSTILWRYYFSTVNDANQAGKLQESYVNQIMVRLNQD